MPECHLKLFFGNGGSDSFQLTFIIIHLPALFYIKNKEDFNLPHD